MANSHLDEDSFVAIDMERLSLLASLTDEQSHSPNPRVQAYRSFSRKAPEAGAAAATSLVGVEESCMESKLAVSVTGDQGTAGMVTPTASRCRRVSKRSSARLDPRRVVVMFATLSSMGTLVLLYLTLSMVSGEDHAQRLH